MMGGADCNVDDYLLWEGDYSIVVVVAMRILIDGNK